MKITYTPQDGDPNTITIGGVMLARGITIDTDDPVVINNCHRNASFHIGDPAALKLDRVLTTAIKQLKEPLRMNLSAVSDRIKQKVELHQKKADEWAAQLDAMDALEPMLFAAGDAAVAARQADMDGLKADFHGLSNIPTSAGSQDAGNSTGEK